MQAIARSRVLTGLTGLHSWRQRIMLTRLVLQSTSIMIRITIAFVQVSPGKTTLGIERPCAGMCGNLSMGCTVVSEGLFDLRVPVFCTARNDRSGSVAGFQRATFVG